MPIIAEELEDLPLKAARAISAVLRARLAAHPATDPITLTRDEAMIALGLVNAVVEALARGVEEPRSDSLIDSAGREQPARMTEPRTVEVRTLKVYGPDAQGALTLSLIRADGSTTCMVADADQAMHEMADLLERVDYGDNARR